MRFFLVRACDATNAVQMAAHASCTAARNSSQFPHDQAIAFSLTTNRRRNQMQCSRSVLRDVLAALVASGLVVSLVAFAGNLPRTSIPAGTAFTYQGQLKVAGAPINGTADVRFSLFDAPSSPAAQIGATVQHDNLTIADGLVSLALDFGDGAFDGNARWLEIELRVPAGGGSFTTLAPRQPITPVPYALFALNAPSATGPIGQSGTTTFGTAQIGVTSSTINFTIIPGLTQTINVPTNCDVHIQSDGGIQTTVTGNASGVSRADIALFIDGQIVGDGGWRRITAANTGGVTASMIANWNLALAASLAAGQHTIEVRTKYDAGATAIVSGDTTSPLQGQLTVTIIKR
jgi:hypothetical protein